MPKIHQLSSQEISKIAAGEVVDRPANIVKELVENALDAHATHIKIFIIDGGKKLVRVIDNGCGMDHLDARACFGHHATSKISSLSDLDSITTFGFRGEALSSIAAVSHVTMITKELETQFGRQLQLEDGKIINEKIIGANVGTDISISDVFYNVPARKKFLKTRETEYRHILHLIHAYCLDYYSIHIEFFSDDLQIINCPPARDLSERVIQLWHHDLGCKMIPVTSQDKSKNITVTGLISDHQYGQYDRSSIYIFVNNRWVKNNHLIKALIKGYNHVLQPGKFPAAVISILIDPAQMDVNIHPRKEEVKFLHPQILENLISTMTSNTLQDNIRSKIKLQQPTAPTEVMFPKTPERFDTQVFKNASRPVAKDIFVFQENSNIDTIELSMEDPFAQKSALEQAHDKLTISPIIDQEQHKELDTNLSLIPIKEEPMAQAMIIGQFNKTYIILDHKDGLMLIDQHAAHERILYEQFTQHFQEIATVKLLFPSIITLTTQDIILLEEQKKFLQMHGIMIESFGQHQIIVSSTPVTLQMIDITDFIMQCIALFREHGQLSSQEIQDKLTKKMRALMACKAAVKAGDMLTKEQMQSIINDLSKIDNNVTCPHGRPTSWIIDTTEIEKKFKRDYKGKSWTIE